MEEWRKEEGEKRGWRELSGWVYLGDDRISSRVDIDGEAAMWKCEVESRERKRCRNSVFIV